MPITACSIWPRRPESIDFASLALASEDVRKVDADEEGIRGDDAADACRYLVATKGRELRLRKLSGL